MKCSLLLLFGGQSSEYEVSLRSAAEILKEIDKDRFTVVNVGITKQGEWRITDCTAAQIASDNWQAGSLPCRLSLDSGLRGLYVTSDDGSERFVSIDVIFPAVHGKNCEDGSLQGLLTLSHIPYVGSGVLASACAFDKSVTRTMVEAIGVPMTPCVVVKKHEYSVDCIHGLMEEKQVNYPVFVKPANSGSSIGVSKVDSVEGLDSAIKHAFTHDDICLVEQGVVGREVECAVLGNENPIASVVGEISTAGGFYDYDAKYINDDAKTYIPAEITAEASDEIREYSLRIFRALDCAGLSRVDFFVTADGEVLFNEINTLPGFTTISMYPKMVMHGGMSYSELITRLLELAMEKKHV